MVVIEVYRKERMQGVRSIWLCSRCTGMSECKALGAYGRDRGVQERANARREVVERRTQDGERRA